MTLTAQRGGTILDHLQDTTPLGLPSTVQVGPSGPLIPIGLDNGNGHTKVALPTGKGDLITQAYPTVYRTAKEIRGGAGITAYRVNGGPAFWIGADALGQDGDALPIGATSERLGDGRQRDFLAVVLVEALILAGYKAGEHRMAVALAIPNDEIVLKKSGDGLGVAKDTRDAIKAHLNGKTFVVDRTSSGGKDTRWTLTYTTIVTQGQSIGTFLAWSRRPNGEAVDSGIEALTIVDIGTGDLQRTDIDVSPYRMTGEKLGKGTVTMARQLATGPLAHLRLNDAQAMQALISRTVREAGQRRDISAEVEQVIAAEGQDLVARLLPILQQQSRYVLFTGGGVLLAGLRQAIEERARAMGKAAPRNFAMVPDRHALTLNAVGALLAVIYAAGGAA